MKEINSIPAKTSAGDYVIIHHMTQIHWEGDSVASLLSGVFTVSVRHLGSSDLLDKSRVLTPVSVQMLSLGLVCWSREANSPDVLCVKAFWVNSLKNLVWKRVLEVGFICCHPGHSHRSIFQSLFTFGTWNWEQCGLILLVGVQILRKIAAYLVLKQLEPMAIHSLWGRSSFKCSYLK